LLRALDEGRLDDARNLAHSLKGSAANIGARKVQKIAESIELPLKQHLADAADLARDRLIDLRLEVAQLISRLATLPDEASAIPQPLVPREETDAGPLIGKLRELLGADDIASQGYFAMHRAEFDQALGSERTRQIAGLIESFDFAPALEALEVGVSDQAPSCSRA